MLDSAFQASKISATVLYIRHPMITKLKEEAVKEQLKNLQFLALQPEGAAIFTFLNPYSKEDVMTIQQLLEDKLDNSLDTPNAYYSFASFDKPTLQLIKQWFLTLQGCLTVILQSEIDSINEDWQFNNSSIGGLYLPPFTLLLYKNYPKIIHPISKENYETRKKIEKLASLNINKFVKRMREAQPDLAGVALLSLVEEKTSLSKEEIVSTILQKSQNIVSPATSPFFTYYE